MCEASTKRQKIGARQRGMDEGKREMSRVTWGASGHVYQQILIWNRKHHVPLQFIIITRPTCHCLPPTLFCSSPLTQLSVCGESSARPQHICLVTFTLGWAGCQSCNLFCTHFHMHISAGQDGTSSAPPELTYHLSRWNPQWVSEPFYSVAHCLWPESAYKHTSGWSLPLWLREPGYFFVLDARGGVWWGQRS